MEDENVSRPLKTILDYHGKPYISVVDEENIVRIQLHSYDNIRPTFVVLDKRALPELIDILGEMW